MDRGDDEGTPSRDGLQDHEMFPSQLRASRRWSQLSGNCKMILEHARRRTKNEDQKFLGGCARVGDVEVVRDLVCGASGKDNT